MGEGAGGDREIEVPAARVIQRVGYLDHTAALLPTPCMARAASTSDGSPEEDTARTARRGSVAPSDPAYRLQGGTMRLVRAYAMSWPRCSCMSPATNSTSSGVVRSAPNSSRVPPSVAGSTPSSAPRV